MTDQTVRHDERPHPNPSPEGEGLSHRRAKKQTTLLDFSVITDSPPLQGRGRGWGLSARLNAEIKHHARTMRNQPTEPEKRMWSILRNRQLDGLKFRRQEQIAGAIADFYCPQKALVVEIDGDTHTDLTADTRRTTKLEVLGCTVVRFTNPEVMQNLEGVRYRLLEIIEGLPDRRAPHPKPSPEGEGLAKVEAQKLLGISLEGAVG